MIIDLKWLKEFLPDFHGTAQGLSAKITSIGHEAEVRDENHLEIEVTPNRGDCFSIYGLARDLAGVFDLQLVEPKLGELPPKGKTVDLTISDEIKSNIHYDLLVEIDNYNQQESPQDIQEKLASLGLSSKNLIVDLTNIVALEMGSPLHVFDFQKVVSGLEICLSTEGQEIVLLDGKNLKLPAGCLIQRTNGQAIDLAGVMGGLESAVDEQTTHFILQAAAFDPSLIRTTSKKSNVVTSASLQYQKGVSPYASKLATERFIYLLNKYQPTVSIQKSTVVEQISTLADLEVDLLAINRLIGFQYEKADLVKLEKLGFVLSGQTISPPAWRTDVSSTADLADELSRVVGLNKLRPTELTKMNATVDSDFRRVQTLKQLLAQAGLTESLSSSFSNRGSVELSNPANKNDLYLRDSLQDSILKSVARNPYMKRVCYFEVGHVFGDKEVAMLGIVSPSLDNPTKKQIAEILGVDLTYEKVSNEDLAKRDIKFGQVVYTQTPLLPILKHIKPAKTYEITLNSYKPISKFPPITRDVSLLVSKSVKPEDISAKLNISPAILLIELTDSYESEKLGQDKISLTFRIIMQDLERSLTDAEADSMLTDCLNNLSKEVQFTLR